MKVELSRFTSRTWPQTNAAADCSRSGYHCCKVNTTEEVGANEVFVGPFKMCSIRIDIPRPDTPVKLMIFTLSGHSGTKKTKIKRTQEPNLHLCSVHNVRFDACA
jgi:hypothetical protein